MSRTIDERIVQMTFNNQEFERRANTTISTLGKLGNALNPLKLTQAFTGMSKAANSLDLSGVSGALDGVGNLHGVGAPWGHHLAAWTYIEAFHFWFLDEGGVAVKPT